MESSLHANVGNFNHTLLLQCFVEGVDLDELKKTRQESQAEMDRHLAETNQTLDELREEVSANSICDVSQTSLQQSLHEHASEAWAVLRTLLQTLKLASWFCASDLEGPPHMCSSVRKGWSQARARPMPESRCSISWRRWAMMPRPPCEANTRMSRPGEYDVHDDHHLS